MDEYTALASVYDEFMDNIEYDAWSKRIIEILKKEGIEKGLVLDLGCGTGIMTELLAKEGYDMTGVDGSEEMLLKAMEKKQKSGLDILYLCQDMRAFELYGTMRAIISTCDCINYITEADELREVFRLANNYLDPRGLFIFDFNTKKKYSDIGNTSITENRSDASFIWENYYSEDDFINEYQLTIFLQVEDDLFRKHEEYHIQRGYDLEEIKKLLDEAGMDFQCAFDGYSDKPADESSERIVVVARERENKNKYYGLYDQRDGSR